MTISEKYWIILPSEHFCRSSAPIWFSTWLCPAAGYWGWSPLGCLGLGSTTHVTHRHSRVTRRRSRALVDMWRRLVNARLVNGVVPMGFTHYY